MDPTFAEAPRLKLQCGLLTFRTPPLLPYDVPQGPPSLPGASTRGNVRYFNLLYDMDAYDLNQRVFQARYAAETTQADF